MGEKLFPLFKMKLYPAFLLLLLAWSANSQNCKGMGCPCYKGSKCDESGMGPSEKFDGVRYCCDYSSHCKLAPIARARLQAPSDMPTLIRLLIDFFNWFIDFS